MQLNLQTFTSLVSSMNTRVQSSVSSIQAYVDTSVGSIVNALNEASAASALWLQYIALQVLSATRLSTSNGDDVTTFISDFELTRLASSVSNGNITLLRNSTITSASVPVGAQVRTGDASQSFYIAGNSASPYWSASVGTGGGYIVPVGVGSIDVPIVAVTPGAAGNVATGAISLVAGIAGISACTNAAPMSGGIDTETDTAVKKRFPLYIASLSKATKSSIEYAISTVQQNLSYTIQTNVDAIGNFAPGQFLIRVDDGSGAPPSSLISSVYTAVNNVKALCEYPTVLPPILTPVNVSLSFSVDSTGTKSLLISSVNNAVVNYIKQLGVNGGLSITRIAYTVYSVDPSINNVTEISINGGPGDLLPPVGGVLKPNIVVVS